MIKAVLVVLNVYNNERSVVICMRLIKSANVAALLISMVMNNDIGGRYYGY